MTTFKIPLDLKTRPRYRGSRLSKEGLHYNNAFLNQENRQEILQWLSTIHPIWENRFSAHNPPPLGQEQRRLLRPVYWLGNWQFACLDYYHPPKGVLYRCVRAEPFPAVLKKLVEGIERTTKQMFRGLDIPRDWNLNTCLVNFYGTRIENGKRIDTARVGEHRDYEPGPVASISLGERALFQFVSSQRPGQRDGVVLQQWLDDGSLQIFGGEQWKDRLFHRVQRVESKGDHDFPINVADFESRRINLTFRFVPEEHILPYSRLPQELADDTYEYMAELAKHSSFFAGELEARKKSAR